MRKFSLFLALTHVLYFARCRKLPKFYPIGTSCGCKFCSQTLPNDSHPSAKYRRKLFNILTINYHHMLIKLLYILQSYLFLWQNAILTPEVLNVRICFLFSCLAHKKMNYISERKKKEKKFPIKCCNQSNVNTLSHYEILEIHFNWNYGIPVLCLPPFFHRSSQVEWNKEMLGSS